MTHNEEIIHVPRQSRDNLLPEQIRTDWKNRVSYLNKIASQLEAKIRSEPEGSPSRDAVLYDYAGTMALVHREASTPDTVVDAWIREWAPKFPRTAECADSEKALRVIMNLPKEEEIHKALQVRAAHHRDYQYIRGEGIYRRPKDLDTWYGRALEYAMLNPAPLGYHWWALTTVLGAACQRRVYMAQGAEPLWANFYVVLGGEKFCGKSAALKIAMEILWKVNEKLEARQNNPDYDKLYHHKRIKILAEEATLKALQMDLGRQLDPSEKDSGRTIDSTGILPLDEMPSYFGKDSYKVTEKFPFFNSCKTANRYAKATGMEGVTELHNCAISMLACCAPAWLRGIIQEEQMGAGFWDRCMVVYRSPVMTRQVLYPGWKLPPRDPVECSWLAQFIVDILDYPKKIPAFLSTEADKYLLEVHKTLISEEHRYKSIHGHTNEIVSAGRMTNFVVQLAMLITLGEGIADPLEIPLRNVEMAWTIVEVEMRSLQEFLEASRSEGIDREAMMLDWIQIKSGGCANLVDIKAVFKQNSHFKNLRGVLAGLPTVLYVLQGLIDAHKVRPCSYNNLGMYESGSRGGRRFYCVQGHEEEECERCQRYL